MGALLPQLPRQVLPGPRPQPGAGIPPVGPPQNAEEEAREDENVSVQGRHCESFLRLWFFIWGCMRRVWFVAFAIDCLQVCSSILYSAVRVKPLNKSRDND